MTDERLGQLATMVRMSAPGSAWSVDVVVELYTEVARLRRLEAGVDRWLVEIRKLVESRIVDCDSDLEKCEKPECETCIGSRATKRQLQQLSAQLPLCAACAGPA